MSSVLEHIDENPPNGLLQIKTNTKKFILLQKVGRQVEFYGISNESGEVLDEVCDHQHNIGDYIRHLKSESQNFVDEDSFVVCPDCEKTIGALFGGSSKDVLRYAEGVAEEYIRNHENVYNQKDKDSEIQIQIYLQVKEGIAKFTEPKSDYSKKYAETYGKEFGKYLVAYFKGAMSSYMNWISKSKEYGKIFDVQKYNDLSGLEKDLLVAILNVKNEVTNKVDLTNAPGVQLGQSTTAFKSKIKLKRFFGVGSAYSVMKALWSEFYSIAKKNGDTEKEGQKKGLATGKKAQKKKKDKKTYLILISEAITFLVFWSWSYYEFLERVQLANEPFVNQAELGLIFPPNILKYNTE